jgi:hypothetical protein
MVQPRDKHIDAAKRLLVHESAGGSAENQAEAAVRVYQKLFRSLAPVIGEAGVDALLARSVRLSRAEFPCLSGVPTTSDTPESNMQRIMACLSKVDSSQVPEVATGLFATFLGLMSNFIGERLVWQIVRSAFPTMKAPERQEKE